MTQARAAFLVVVSLVLLSIGITGIFAQVPAPKSLQSDPILPIGKVPPVNTASMSDPSGSYVFYNITYTQVGNLTINRYSMNLASYEQLQNDPYSTGPPCEMQVVGNMAMVTCTWESINATTSLFLTTQPR
jgi:uncharacterized protein (UPF0333 family)